MGLRTLANEKTQFRNMGARTLKMSGLNRIYNILEKGLVNIYYFSISEPT